MTEVCIQSGPFSLNFDGEGEVTISPDLGAFRCWFEIYNGRLYRCCDTPTGRKCWPIAYMNEILTEPPEELEQSS